MNRFKAGYRYKAHNSKDGMLVISRFDNMLLINVDGKETIKSVGVFINSEIVWTDGWHVAIANKLLEESK